MTEIYKDIKDLEGLYQVSNFGQILSLNYHRTGKPKLMKPGKDKHGYLGVGLCKNGKRKWFSIHRLVAKAFLPNPNNLSQINHKDEDKTNNSVENLEWCTREYNTNYGTRNERIVKANTNGKCSKRVLQLSLSGDLIREWPSTRECARNGFNQGAVAACCRGKLPHYKGYKWCYT